MQTRRYKDIYIQTRTCKNTLSNTDKLLWLAITVLCAPCESYKHIYHFLCYNYYLYIYIFTNTPLFIDIMFDPVIFVEQVYMADEKKSPRCLHQWNPHDGKPLSALFFLDNHKNPTPEWVSLMRLFPLLLLLFWFRLSLRCCFGIFVFCGVIDKVR